MAVELGLNSYDEEMASCDHSMGFLLRLVQSRPASILSLQARSGPLRVNSGTRMSLGAQFSCSSA